MAIHSIHRTTQRDHVPHPGPGRIVRRVLAACCAAVVFLLWGSGGARAQGPNRVALVVRYADGDVQTRCIEFAEPEITGLDVLQRSGLEVVYAAAGTGALICKIDDLGCDDPRACLCQCKGAECVYWSYWHVADGGWQYALAGASQRKVRDRDVEGWAWGPGTIANAPQPPPVRFEEVCAPPTAIPSPTAEPTHTPAPPTATPPRVPATRAAGTLTPLPTATSTATPIPSTSTAVASAVTEGATEGDQPPRASGSYLVFAAAIALLVGAALVVRRKGAL